MQINLPPLIENEKGRKQVASTLEKSRENFRKFRDSLSQDIGTSKGKMHCPELDSSFLICANFAQISLI